MPAGNTLPADTAERALLFFRGLPCGTRSSMLIDQGKPLEVPWLAGRIRELGAAHGIPTPANAAVVDALAPYAAGASAGKPAPRSQARRIEAAPTQPRAAEQPQGRRGATGPMTG